MHALGLIDTKVTDSGLKDLGKLTALQYLALSGTQVTHTKIKELREQFPNARIKG